MPLIVNLSTVNKLRSTHEVLKKFTDICNRYSKNTCGVGFYGMSNYAWVTWKFLQSRDMINQYKLGELTTDEFLSQLLNILSFLKDHMSDQQAKELIAETWNNYIDWDDHCQVRLNKLLECSKQEPIYFISNSNELNIRKIIALFHEAMPDFNWHHVVTTIKDNKQPLELAPNVFLCVSYNYGLLKEGTPGLLAEVAKTIPQGPTLPPIKVVSQFQKDLDLASGLGGNILCYRDTDFYVATADVTLASLKKQIKDAIKTLEIEVTALGNRNQQTGAFLTSCFTNYEIATKQAKIACLTQLETASSLSALQIAADQALKTNDRANRKFFNTSTKSLRVSRTSELLNTIISNPHAFELKYLEEKNQPSLPVASMN